MINHTNTFVARLLETARTGADVPLGDYLADLATDVIGSCVVGYDMGSQKSAEGEREKGPDGLLTILRDSVALQPHFFGSGLLAGIRRLSARCKLKDYQRCVRYLPLDPDGLSSDLPSLFTLETCYWQYRC